MSGDASHVPIQQLPETERTREIQDAFVKEYKKKPDFFVRVPGRVNLIGEHVDYCGYSVCPMALEQDILLAISIENDSKLNLHNLDKHFEDYQCDLHSLEISIGDGAPKWYQYFLCGVKGVIDVLPKGNKLKGMNIFAKGSIPQSAGLSSSSALVSAAALATAYANKFEMSKNKLASLSAECERYIGTEGGGMDQAIAFLATEAHIRVRRFTCDVLSAEAKGVKLNDAACGLHCLLKGRTGGYCNGKRVCVCR